MLLLRLLGSYSSSPCCSQIHSSQIHSTQHNGSVAASACTKWTVYQPLFVAHRMAVAEQNYHAANKPWQHLL